MTRFTPTRTRPDIVNDTFENKTASASRVTAVNLHPGAGRPELFQRESNGGNRGGPPTLAANEGHAQDTLT